MRSPEQLSHTSNSPESESQSPDSSLEWTDIANEVPFDPEQARNLYIQESQRIPEEDNASDSLPENLADESWTQEGNYDTLGSNYSNLETENNSDTLDSNNSIPEAKPKKLGNMLELKVVLAEARRNNQSEDEAWENYWSDHEVPDVSNNITVAGNNPYYAFRLDRNLQRKLELIDSQTPYEKAKLWLEEVESDMQSYGAKATEGGILEQNLQEARKIVKRKARNPFNRLRDFFHRRTSGKKPKNNVS